MCESIRMVSIFYLSLCIEMEKVNLDNPEGLCVSLLENKLNGYVLYVIDFYVISNILQKYIRFYFDCVYLRTQMYII